jgi:hypothetical protein
MPSWVTGWVRARRPLGRSRADFERERERCDTLVVEALKLGTLS